MTNNQITFNDLPQVVAELRDEVSGMKALLLNLQNRPTQQRENRHRPVTPEQVAEYTNIPLATIYQKLANREIPGSKPGKRWVIYLDEIDKWLETNRKNHIPLALSEKRHALGARHVFALFKHKRHPLGCLLLLYIKMCVLPDGVCESKNTLTQLSQVENEVKIP